MTDGPALFAFGGRRDPSLRRERCLARAIAAHNADVRAGGTGYDLHRQGPVQADAFLPKPFRIDAATDTNNFQGRHTAAFSNDGKKVIQTDEWGGGTGPMCQAGSMIELGGNTILTLDAKKKQQQRGYFKLPAAQSAEENCVSHNGGLIPVPGRDLYVQGWYQGGVDIMDFTDPDHAFEVGYFDRGSIDPPAGADVPVAARAGTQPADFARSRNTIGGSWGAYYWNGMIFSSELDRGLDILELTPSANLSANEIAAAKLVQFVQYNPQSQPKMTWPAAFVVVRSYLDQLVRNTIDLDVPVRVTFVLTSQDAWIESRSLNSVWLFTIARSSGWMNRPIGISFRRSAQTSSKLFFSICATLRRFSST